MGETELETNKRRLLAQSQGRRFGGGRGPHHSFPRAEVLALTLRLVLLLASANLTAAQRKGGKGEGEGGQLLAPLVG